MANTIRETLLSLEHDIGQAAASHNDGAKWQHVFQELKTDLQNYKGNEAKLVAYVAGWSLQDAGLIDKFDIIRGVGVTDNEIMVYRTANYRTPGTLVEVTGHEGEHPHQEQTCEAAKTTEVPSFEGKSGVYFVWLDPYKPKP